LADPYVAANRKRINTQRRARYAKDSSKTLAGNRAYRLRNVDELKRRRRLRVYGTDGEALWQEQGGLCAICVRPMLRRHRHNRAAHLDHDHVTKKVRAWLCGRCNTGIGLFGEDPALLDKARRYVVKHA
jgi:hypothetical protein